MSKQPMVVIDPRKSDRDAVMTSIEIDPHNPIVNGWTPGIYRTAFLCEDWEWNPLMAPVPDNSGRYAVIGGVHWLDSVITAMESGPVPTSLNWRVWNFAEKPIPEFCELMRVYFHRKRLQQATFRHQMVPSYQDNRLANLSAEQFMEEAVGYHEAVYSFWKQFSN